MRAGLLDTPCTIYHATVTRSELGEQETTLGSAIFTRCRVIINRRQRTLDNDEIWSPSSLQIEIRIYHNVIENDRVVVNGKTYYIESFEIDKQLQCKRLNLIQYNG